MVVSCVSSTRAAPARAQRAESRARSLRCSLASVFGSSPPTPLLPSGPRRAAHRASALPRSQSVRSSGDAVSGARAVVVGPRSVPPLRTGYPED